MIGTNEWTSPAQRQSLRVDTRVNHLNVVMGVSHALHTKDSFCNDDEVKVVKGVEKREMGQGGWLAGGGGTAEPNRRAREKRTLWFCRDAIIIVDGFAPPLMSDSCDEERTAAGEVWWLVCGRRCVELSETGFNMRAVARSFAPSLPPLGVFGTS